MVGQSFRPHHLPEEFTDEVLKRVRALRVEGPQEWGVIGKEAALLMQDEQKREFPVRFAAEQAFALSTVLGEVRAPRPMTYELFTRALEAFDIKLDRVLLTYEQRGEFSSRMLFACGRKRHVVSARAADGVALAQSVGAGVFATPTTLRKARRLKTPTPPGTPTAAATQRTFTTTMRALSRPSFAVVEPAKQDLSEGDMQRRIRQRPRRWPRMAWEKQIEVNVVGVLSDPVGNNELFVILADPKSRQLPVCIGPYEAQAIGRALKIGVVSINLPPAPKEPMAEFAHDSMKSVLDAFGVRMVRMAIDALLQNTFYGVVALQRNGKVRYVDARPSDAIALAVRFGCPLFVTREVWRKASISPEQE